MATSSPTDRLNMREEAGPHEPDSESLYRQHGNWLMAFLRRRFSREEVGDDLALRGQQAAVPRRPRLQAEEVGCDKPMQKVSRGVADDFDHATIGKNLRQLHHDYPWKSP